MPRIPFVLALLLLAGASAVQAAPSNNMTKETLDAEVARLSALVASLQNDKASSKGVAIRGEDLPKPAEVPRALWPDVGNNEYNWEDSEERNYKLSNANLAFESVVGIETPAFAADGTAFLPDNEGRLWRFPPPLLNPTGAAAQGEIIARLPGRPLGIAVDNSASLLVGGGRSLVVAVAGAGIYRVSLASSPSSLPAVVTQLTSYAAADPTQFPLVPSSASGRVLYANGVLISGSGTIYFTDSLAAPPAPPATLRGPQVFDTFAMSLGSLYSGDLGGRLCRYDPTTGQTVVISTGSWFSNGIAFSDSKAAAAAAGGNEQAIVMCETFSARLVLVPLRGAHAGEIQPFARSLPGYCDGVFGVAPPLSSIVSSTSTAAEAPEAAAAAAKAAPATTTVAVEDSFWVSVNSKLTAGGATALAASPQLRWAAARVPQQVVELVAPPFGLVVKVDQTGSVAESLQDPTGVAVGRASSAVVSPDGKTLFMGSITRPGLAYIRL